MRSLVNISEAASWALHTMVLLAGGDPQRLTNQQLASRLQASSHHLAKVMRRLVQAGLVDSVRRPQGGFRLGKPADDIRLIEVYEAVEVPTENYWRRQIKCQYACPVNTDARGYVRAIAEGRFEDAYLIARGPNPLASICGRVCGAPCEASCAGGTSIRRFPFGR